MSQLKEHKGIGKFYHALCPSSSRQEREKMKKPVKKIRRAIRRMELAEQMKATARKLAAWIGGKKK